jgi:transketolase
MEMLSRVHARNLVEWAKDRPEVLVLSADLTSSTEIDGFRAAYPDRFISLGIAEQNMLSFAGGLAREGFLPMVHTFAVFIYRRAYDQVAMSVAYPDANVKMFGFLPGITTPGGATHQAIEDVALMRALPNLTVVEAGDATEMRTLLPVVADHRGPVYIRSLRGEIPRLFPESEPFRLDTPRVLSRGTDVALFSSGICTEEALRATALLRGKGVSIQHLHISTHKPFRHPSILEAAAGAKHGVITIENHVVTGGLGSAVAERMAGNGVGKRLLRIGLNDVFSHGASKPYLMREHGIDALALVRRVEELVGEHFGIAERDLAEVRIDAVHSESKAEGL